MTLTACTPAHRGTALLAVGGCALALGACESTQDQSARLAKHGASLLNQKGLTVQRTNPSVKVLEGTVLHDSNGTAAVLTLRSDAARTEAKLPISIAVLDAAGRPQSRNDAAGLEQSLVKVPLLEPHRPTVWIDDQVTGASDPHSVQAKVGVATQTAAGPLPHITLSNVHMKTDPVNGIEVAGTVRNDSKIAQVRLVVYAVARKHGKVVAAGRAGVPLLNPAPTPKPVRFTLFFIGDPTGAKLELAAPPTTLK